MKDIIKKTGQMFCAGQDQYPVDIETLAIFKDMYLDAKHDIIKIGDNEF